MSFSLSNSISCSIRFSSKVSLSRARRGKFPFHYELFKKNRDADFLILLNMQLTSGNSRREKLKTLVHETLHFIKNLKKTRTNFESIENEADRIIDEFLFSRARVNLMKR